MATNPSTARYGYGPTLPIQPLPLVALAVRHRTPSGEWTTAIYRRFVAGQARLCRLCPAGECSARRWRFGEDEFDECILAVDGHVPAGQAKYFRSPAEGADALGLDVSV